MAKIIKVGRADPSWAREFECKSCGAVVEIGRADLTVRKKHDICGPRLVASAKGPCCGATITIADPADASWGDLPSP